MSEVVEWVWLLGTYLFSQMHGVKRKIGQETERFVHNKSNISDISCVVWFVQGHSICDASSVSIHALISDAHIILHFKFYIYTIYYLWFCTCVLYGCEWNVICEHIDVVCRMVYCNTTSLKIRSMIEIVKLCSCTIYIHAIVSMLNRK